MGRVISHHSTLVILSEAKAKDAAQHDRA